MSMGYGREYAEDVAVLVQDFVAQFRKHMADARKGQQPIDDQVEPTDEEFARWYEYKTEQNPNWAIALPYVEGGMDLIKRYEKVRGIVE